LIREKIAFWLMKTFDLGSVINSWDMNKSWGKQRPVDYDALVNRYSGFVYRCASQNANTLSSIPMRLYVKGRTARFPSKALESRGIKSLESWRGKALGDVSEVLEHPILLTLNDANSAMTGRELALLTHLYNELTGNAYWYVERGALGVPTAIWPLMSQWVRIVPDEQRFVAGYLYGKSTAKQQAYDAEEVLHFLYPNPKDYFYGLSPLEAVVGDVDLATAQMEHEQALYDNQARPDFILKVNSTMPEESRKRLYSEWLQAFRGRNKQGKPVILQGDMEVTPIGFSPRDTGLLASAKFSREKIANAFGIPLTMLENSQSRAEAEAQLYGYMRDTIVPRLRLFEARLNERLCPLYDDRLFVAFDDPVPENRDQRLAQMDTRLRNGVTSINEERQIDGLEEADWGAVPLISTTLQPIGTPPPNAFPGLRGAKAIGDGHVDPLEGAEVGFAKAVERVLAKTVKEVEGNLV
jgi:HK97 family phage portal protein